MDQTLFKDLEATINPDAKPCYCSVVLQRGHEVTVEGWLLQTNNPGYVIIQPSVVYEAGGVKLAFHFDEVLSITPTYPPEPFHAQVALPTFDATAGLGYQKFESLTPTINREAFMRP